MEILQLKYFVAAARFEHISRAAESLHIAQPALSQSIKRLEAELGVSFFDRSGNRIVLNDKGRKMLDMATNVLSDIERIKYEMSPEESKKTDTIQIALKDGFFVFSHLFNTFREQHPYVEFAVELEPDNDNIISLIIDSGPSGSLPSGSIYLFDEELVLIVSTKSPFALRSSVSLSELKGSTFAINRHKKLSDLTDIYCRRAGFTPQISYKVKSNHDIQFLVQTDVAVAFWPKSILGEVLDPRIVSVAISRPHCIRSFYIIPPNSRPLTSSERLFCEFAETYEMTYK